jgi:hypothetical protein
MIEAVLETSVNINVTTLRYIPEDTKLHDVKCLGIRLLMNWKKTEGNYVIIILLIRTL